MKKILVVDNHDSFVYNLVHYLDGLDCEISVLRNDEILLEEIKKYEKILISPGPGLPKEATILREIIQTYAPSKDIFGVCLGQQAIAEAFGSKLINLEQVYHGVSTRINICVEDEPLFLNLKTEIEVGRYHSWVVENKLPECLEATSYDKEGNIMSLRHRWFNVRAVQFHPESVLTPHGRQIILNWVNY